MTHHDISGISSSLKVIRYSLDSLRFLSYQDCFTIRSVFDTIHYYYIDATDMRLYWKLDAPSSGRRMNQNEPSGSILQYSCIQYLYRLHLYYCNRKTSTIGSLTKTTKHALLLLQSTTSALISISIIIIMNKQYYVNNCHPQDDVAISNDDDYCEHAAEEHPKEENVRKQLASPPAITRALLYPSREDIEAISIPSCEQVFAEVAAAAARRSSSSSSSLERITTASSSSADAYQRRIRRKEASFASCFLHESNNTCPAAPDHKDKEQYCYTSRRSRTGNAVYRVVSERGGDPHETGFSSLLQDKKTAAARRESSKKLQLMDAHASYHEQQQQQKTTSSLLEQETRPEGQQQQQDPGLRGVDTGICCSLPPEDSSLSQHDSYYSSQPEGDCSTTTSSTTSLTRRTSMLSSTTSKSCSSNSDTTSTTTSAAPPQPRSELEVSPGVFLPLYGADETYTALQQGQMQAAHCLICGLGLQCVNRAEYILCPDCKVVSPVFGGTASTGAVGLGMTVTTTTA